MSAASRGLDSQPVAGAQRAEALPGNSSPFSRFLPGAPGSPPSTPGGAVAAPLGDQRVAHLVERLELAGHAVAAARRPAPPESRRSAYLDGAQRELELERLDRRVQRVRHGHVDGARTVGVRARALAAAERLVVGEAARCRA